jgi:hypothetical protein
MPEALALVAVVVIAVVIYFAMWMQTRDPAMYKPHEEHVRLQQQVRWLEERLAAAEREQWGEDMVAAIEAEHAVTVQQLAQMSAAVAARG